MLSFNLGLVLLPYFIHIKLYDINANDSITIILMSCAK